MHVYTCNKLKQCSFRLFTVHSKRHCLATHAAEYPHSIILSVLTSCPELRYQDPHRMSAPLLAPHLLPALRNVHVSCTSASYFISIHQYVHVHVYTMYDYYHPVCPLPYWPVHQYILSPEESFVSRIITCTFTCACKYYIDDVGKLTFDPGVLEAMETASRRAGPRAVCPPSSNLQYVHIT